jgi:type III pantothenate kinase
MLIGIDVGNTNITVGLFEEGQEGVLPERSWRFNTVRNATSDEIAAPLLAHLLTGGIDPALIRHAVVSSVVPQLFHPLKLMFRKTFRIADPLFVDHTTDTGLVFAYPNPEEIGADRIVNAAAGIMLYGAPLIVIDFGTATTFCCIDAAGAYLGGEILPGVGISLEALTTRAARLSEVRLSRPLSPLGRTTTQGIVSGIFYQTVGAVEKITALLAKEMGTTPRVLATGGFAGFFAEATPVIEVVDQDLTLKGLRYIYDRCSRA